MDAVDATLGCPAIDGFSALRLSKTWRHAARRLTIL
jgi:hypothetical protein